MAGVPSVLKFYEFYKISLKFYGLIFKNNNTSSFGGD